MIYNENKNSLDMFFLSDKILENKINYRRNIIFLSILISYIVYVSPLYAMNSSLLDLILLISSQSIGMIIILHACVTVYASSFGGLLKLWSKRKDESRERLSLNRYKLKVMLSDTLCKVFLVFFVSSFFLNQELSFILMGSYFFIVKAWEMKKEFGKKYSEIIFSSTISFAILLISLSFMSAIIISALNKITS